jgi:hypothetical protein
MGVKLGTSPLWEEQRVRIFVEKVLRKKCEPMKEAVIGGRRKL